MFLPPYQVFADFLPESHRRALLDMALAREAEFQPTSVKRDGGDVVDPARRISSKLPDMRPLRPPIKQALLDAAPALFRAAGVPPFDIAHIETELVAHNDGAHFAPHRDTLAGVNRTTRDGAPLDRVVSGVYYFHAQPKAFSGGALRLHPFHAAPGTEPVDIEPDQNSLVVFPSFALHEVRPVSCPSRRFADSRFAVNCWLYKAA